MNNTIIQNTELKQNTVCIKHNQSEKKEKL
jgi:hypothetical protein